MYNYIIDLTKCKSLNDILYIFFIVDRPLQGIDKLIQFQDVLPMLDPLQ